jgi:hypothetical protein
MSGYTNTMAELFYSYDQAATTTTPTASAVNAIATYPVAEIYGGWFSALGTKTTSLKLSMGGLMTATATVPTWQLSLIVGTTNAFATSPVLVASAAFTPVAGTNAWWFMDVDIALRTLVPGGSSTISAHGKAWGALFPSPFLTSLPATGAYTPLATYAADANAYLWPALTLSAATAGNTITTQYMKLYGEN